MTTCALVFDLFNVLLLMAFLYHKQAGFDRRYFQTVLMVGT